MKVLTRWANARSKKFWKIVLFIPKIFIIGLFPLFYIFIEKTNESEGFFSGFVSKGLNLIGIFDFVGLRLEHYLIFLLVYVAFTSLLYIIYLYLRQFKMGMKYKDGWYW